ncbi:hypothetical protein K488DRAFT_87990 [Vararia minispora EC-137]|uniref:Uncharacterized protein n=1 Tax=Vararia minispora EC-137 TaxID=1314806 RepID=A0ACB8QEN8_9AGAM|nr:hypothetical protein K488DRAFT_87990 [Vararia minispora EC-137]
MPRPPEIRGTLGRVILAHRTLGRTPDEEFGDTESLAVIGRRVLPLVVADILSRKRPILSAMELEHEIEDKLSYETYNELVTAFNLREEIFCTPEAKETLREPSETETLIHSWVAAVYLQDGISGVIEWLGAQIDQSFDPTSVQDQKRHRSTDQGSQPPQPLTAPPPVPTTQNPLAVPQADGSRNSATYWLALFNQTATQKQLQVKWEVSSSGAAHTLDWRAECIINGVCKGSGSNKSKQAAKEIAARDAFYAMGWAGGASN